MCCLSPVLSCTHVLRLRLPCPPVRWPPSLLTRFFTPHLTYFPSGPEVTATNTARPVFSPRPWCPWTWRYWRRLYRPWILPESTPVPPPCPISLTLHCACSLLVSLVYNKMYVTVWAVLLECLSKPAVDGLLGLKQTPLFLTLWTCHPVAWLGLRPMFEFGTFPAII